MGKYLILFLILFIDFFETNAQKSEDLFVKSTSSLDIYHKNWIDLNKNGKKDIYEDKSIAIDKRIDDLLSKMSLDEKVMQLATLYGFGRVLEDELPTEDWKNEVWKNGLANIDEHLNGVARHPEAITQYSSPASKHARAINETQKFFVESTRLGIPVDFTNEGIRGLCHQGATGFPSQIGIGSTWNPALALEIGKIIGKEARILGYTNVYSPVLDLARDPRWGRVVECFGEDPYLVSELGVNMVRGIQSENVASTVKHFAVYSIPKGGRDGHVRTDPKVGLREMYQMHLRPFERVVKEANVLGVMSSYNDYDGIPISSSTFFLKEILREKWGFNGYVVSDSWVIGGLEGRHNIAKNFKEAVHLAIEAGLNVRTNFTPTADYIYPLKELIEEGSISIEQIDELVRDVLFVKYKLRLFDNPFVHKPSKADDLVGSSNHQKVSLQASRESIVLLKNENSLLPLNPLKLKSVLITGPNAKDVEHSISRYGPSGIHVTSIYDGILSYLGEDTEVVYAKGCDFFDENWPKNELYNLAPSAFQQNLIEEAVEKAKSVDVIFIALGDNYETVGESRSRTSLNLPGNQQQLLEAMHKTGKPVVLLLLNGRALTINWADRFIPAIVEAWNPGPYGGKAIAEAVFGAYNPGGKLPVTFPKTVGQIPYNFPFKRNSQGGQPIEGPNGRGNTRINGALYPFGFGLSYTSFTYKNLEIKGDLLEEGQLRLSFDITNSGEIAGDEVAQLYITDEHSSVVTYESVLRSFKRIHLKPGETKEVQFSLQPTDLSIIDKDWQKVAEKGQFTFKVGSSSEDIRLNATYELQQNILIENLRFVNNQ